MSLKPRGDWGGTLNPPRTFEHTLIDLSGEIADPRASKVCFIAHTPELREFKAREFREREVQDVVVTSPGASVMGMRIITVILTAETFRSIQDDHRKFDWWRESLLCRLLPESQIIVLP